jgi:Ca-activated chloride channel family protein
MLLVSPRAELSKDQKVPRDIVFVVDTSGSMMHENKMEQTKQALRHCLDGLSADDRFALISFATTVNRYRDEWVPVNEEHLKRAKGWVADLYAGGGTAIHQALTSALEMRTDDADRMFTVVFFTDGQPTIGETDIDRILADVTKNNTANTRIFSFGVGNDLNAVFLDQIAERTHAVSRYVRPGEDLEAKVAGFFEKIHHPVLAKLKLTASSDVRLLEVYPPQLPDLFHGDQLVVLARYQGSGQAEVVLNGKVGVHDKRFVYDLDFLPHTDDKPFIEELWARRKVGYLLDQIRVNGEQRELVDEVVGLAKSYGITTPYTSYLIMPDAPIDLAAREAGGAVGRVGRRDAPAALAPSGGFGGGYGGQAPLEDFARKLQREKGNLASSRNEYQDRYFRELDADPALNRPSAATAGPKPAPQEEALQRLTEAKRLKSTLDMAQSNFQRGEWRQNQVNALGVDLAVCTNNLKCQTQLQANAIRRVANRTCMEIGGVWIDEGFTAQTPTIAIKAQSDAYFQILQQQPQMKEVLQLGNHVLWVAPNGTALVVDTTTGKERMSIAEIDALFGQP